MKGNRYPNVEDFYTDKLEWNHLLLSWTKEEAKMARTARDIQIYC